MAKSHHRRNHKEHLKHFQGSFKSSTQTTKGNPKLIFSIIGAVVGFSVLFFSGTENIVLWIGGLIASLLIGYFIGKNIQ